MINCPHCGEILPQSVNWIEHSKTCRITNPAFSKDWCMNMAALEDGAEIGVNSLGQVGTIEVTTALCESFKEIGIDISEIGLRRFEKALYERGLNVAPLAPGNRE